MNDGFRWFAVNSTKTAQTARDLHDLSPISTMLLSKLLSAAAMLSWDLKSPLSEMTLKVDGDGELGGGMVICTAQGELRGYVKNPGLFLVTPEANFQLGKALGRGTLTLLRNEPHHKPYQGTCELLSGEIADDLAYYFQQSEQLPTAVNLGILIDQHAKVRASGGYIIQQLPFADPHQADKLMENLNATPNLSDLMDMGMTVSDILTDYVFKGLEWKIYETREITYRCNCNRERFAKALLLLGDKELSEMKEGIEPVCHFCNAAYRFSAEDITAMLNELTLAKDRDNDKV